VLQDFGRRVSHFKKHLIKGAMFEIAINQAAELLGIWLNRLPTGADHLKMSGLVALTMASRGIGVMVVLLAVTVANKSVGVCAVVVYALAYTLSLGVSLVEYFTGPAR
jgi:hypothetical protein